MTRYQDLNQIAQQLRDRRVELLEESELELRELRNEFDGLRLGDGPKQIDFECDEVAAAVANHMYDEILQIDHALELIDEGNYGFCEDCGCQISAARLEILPFATMCASCQATAEGTSVGLQYGSSDWDDDESPSDPYTEFSLPVVLKF